MIIASIDTVVLLLTLVGAPGDLPRLDIHRVCGASAEFSGDASDVRGCLHDEKAARNHLRAAWAHIPFSAKKACVYENVPPGPSYVVLASCIDSSVQAGNLRASGSQGGLGVELPDFTDR